MPTTNNTESAESMAGAMGNMMAELPLPLRNSLHEYLASDVRSLLDIAAESALRAALRLQLMWDSMSAAERRPWKVDADAAQDAYR